MLASKLVEKIQDMINRHGDKHVVSGLDRSGYGEPVEDVDVVADNLFDANGEPLTVFDLILSDESSCAVGGF